MNGKAVVGVLVLMAFAFATAGCEGPEGPAGAAGAAGKSCTVTDNQDGTKTVTCEDGTSVTLYDGEDGGTGPTGPKGDKGDAGEAGTPGEDGENGLPGEDGEDGLSCTVLDNGNGSKTISCEDGTTATVFDGADGQSAAELFSLKAEMPAKLFMTIDSVVINSKPVVNFQLRDAAGRGAVGLPTNLLRWVLAKLVVPVDGPSYWEAYTRSSTGGPTSERNGTLVDHGDGTYTYTFATDVTNVTTPVAITWDAAATTRLTGQLSGSVNGVALPALNFVKDFVPAGGDLPATREIATTDACNECHGKLTLHGSRTEVQYCVVCHAKDVTDPNGVNIDMGYMTHAIHAAALREANGAPEYAIYSSHSAHLYTYGHIGYPQGNNNCLKCHDAADSANGGNWNTVPSIQTCKGCHESAAYADHVDGMTDAQCASCHGADKARSAAKMHVSENNSPNATGVVEGASNFIYEVKEAVVNGDGTTSVTFKITRDGTAMDLTAQPADLTGGPSFLLAYALPQDGIDAPLDYNNLGRSAAQPRSVSLANLRSGSAGAIAAGTDGYYVATINLANSFPAGATLRAVGLQGYYTQTGLAGGSLGRHTVASYKPVTGDTVRREVVDSAKCADCHEWFEGHGGNRVYEVGVCVMCHVPNLSTSGRGAAIANVTQATKDALTAAGYDGDDPLTYPEYTNNMKEMIHAIHGSHVKTVPFQEVRDRGTSGVYYYDFSHVTYPTAANNCLMCHKAGTFDDVPAGALATTFITDNGAIAAPADVAAARNTVPNALDVVQTPYAGACAACHDTPLAAAHMEQNGAMLNVTRDMLGGMETCVLCHGAGRAADVNVVHGL